jgi:hypothetical protein
MSDQILLDHIQDRLDRLEDFQRRIDNPQGWLEEKIAALKIDGVESIRLQFRDDFEGDPTVYFRVVLNDYDKGKFSERYENCYKPVERSARDLVSKLAERRFSHFRYRTHGENEKLKDGGW